jgi:hypothetical protein
MAVAARVLSVAAPELTPPRPVRRTGEEPRMVEVVGTDGSRRGATPGDLARTVAEVAAGEVAAFDAGRVAVLAPESLLPLLAESMASSGLAVVDARDMRKGGLSEPLVLLAADATNGLEFDSVVVVEPGIIAGETARGLRTLYVALTRPTQRLTVVYLASPPSSLDGTHRPSA